MWRVRSCLGELDWRKKTRRIVPSSPSLSRKRVEFVVSERERERRVFFFFFFISPLDAQNKVTPFFFFLHRLLSRFSFNKQSWYGFSLLVEISCSSDLSPLSLALGFQPSRRTRRERQKQKEDARPIAD